MAPHPAPTAPCQSTKTPSDLAQHQAAHAKAAPRALQLPEIVENVLIYLLIRDLIAHQRVSKTFQTTIAESPALRRKMFPTLGKAPPESWKLRIVNGEKTRLGKTRWHFVSAKDSDSADYDSESDDYDSDSDGPDSDDDRRLTTTPATLNPLLELDWYMADGNCAAQRKRWYTFEKMHLKNRNRTVGPDSSLLDTYISDPPCKVLEASTEFTPRGATQVRRPFSETVTIRSETGLKLSDIWDVGLDARGNFLRREGKEGHTWESTPASLREFLSEQDVRVTVLFPWSFTLKDVVVPTAEEWDDVKHRGAQK
jgi:hypothetical protein